MRPFQLIIHWFSSNMSIDLLAFRYIETNIICIIGDFQTTTGNNEWSLLVKIQFLLVNPFFCANLPVWIDLEIDEATIAIQSNDGFYKCTRFQIQIYFLNIYFNWEGFSRQIQTQMHATMFFFSLSLLLFRFNNIKKAAK